jgi:hypothetical protein
MEKGLASILTFLCFAQTNNTFAIQSALNVTMTLSSPRGIVIFSGGSAANNLVNVFSKVAEGRGTLSYVIPISDNGGSTYKFLSCSEAVELVF